MYICICEQVTDTQIKNAIKEGATSVRDLKKELGIASQCGQCGQCAKALLKEHSCKKTCQKVTAKASAIPMNFAKNHPESIAISA